jgi:hypothetical protein
MKHRDIQEVFRAVQPKAHEGITGAPAISAKGVTGQGNHSSSSLHANRVEEVVQPIRPGTHGGRTVAPPISVGVASDQGGLSPALSQAGQQIAQLQSAYQQQAALIIANTQAIQSNTSAHSSSSALSTAGNVASGFFGGALGLLSPIISGIESLFGGHSAPAPIPFYVPPPPISISAVLSSAAPNAAPPAAAAPAGPVSPGNSANLANAPQITVNVNAMDSQSFMDRSGDIASAVREAMLNLHPINDVIASL